MPFLVFLGAIFGVTGLLVLTTILRGYVLSIMWGWFMVPTLGLPKLSIVQAIGIAAVISFLTYQDNSGTVKKQRSASEAFTEALVIAACYPLVVLLFGWVVHLYM